MATLLDLSQYLDKLAVLHVESSDLRIAADNQVERIRERTAQGIGVDLQIFQPYARKTKKAPPVSLRDSGEMLNSIAVSADNNQASIGFSDPIAAEKAGFHNNGTLHMPARPFFGTSLSDIDEIVSDIRSLVFQRVNK